MQKEIFFLSLIVLIGISTNNAYSQEISLATFQETAQIIVDKSISQNVTASITLQSTSIQEIKIPVELEQRIREDVRIKSIILTNQNQCVLGVVDQSCIMINVALNLEDMGIFAIQDSTKEIAELYIDEINQAFDTDAEFHSVFIHTTTNFDCGGDDCVFWIGDGLDVTGFITATDAELQATFTEQTGFAAGYYGIEAGSQEAYTLDDGGPFVYEDGAEETIDWELDEAEGETISAGAMTIYVMYTRIQ